MASKKEGREFDLVIFGATGFTGTYVVEYVTKLEEKGLKWAIAGRNLSKLKAVLEEVSTITGRNIKDVATIEADVTNEGSLAGMCQRAKLIINCVGPYKFYGEPVVKACVENGSHYIDITAEPLFAESMQMKYHEAACQANVFIVSQCGFDSLPCETGVHFLQQYFDGDINYIEPMLELNMSLLSYGINNGTLHSIIHLLNDADKLRPLRDQIFTKPLPVSVHPPRKRKRLDHSDEVNKWSIYFPNTDGAIVNRTQYYNYHNRRMRPVQVADGRLIAPNLFMGVVFYICSLIFFLMIPLKCGRYLLRKFPALCTFGIFSNHGVAREKIERASFSLYVIGYGYHYKNSNPDDQHTDLPNKTMVVKVSGPDPGYVTTAICVVQGALTMLQETENLPEGGGVLTPLALLHNTNVISRLRKAGMAYEVIT